MKLYSEAQYNAIDKTILALKPSFVPKFVPKFFFQLLLQFLIEEPFEGFYHILVTLNGSICRLTEIRDN